MAKNARIIYADGDATRSNKVVSGLKSAGHIVCTCTGRDMPPPELTVRPDLVLLHHDIGEDLRLFAETLWPGVPCQIVQCTCKEDLVALVESALSGRDPS